MGNVTGWEFRIPISVMEKEEYLKFCGRKSFALYCIMYSYIVRSSFEFWPLGVDIYNNYYRNGYLACRWSQRHFAEKLMTDQSKVSRMIKELEDNEYIKVDKVKHKGKKSCIYVLGTHDFDEKENLYLWKNMKAEPKKEENLCLVGAW